MIGRHLETLKAKKAKFIEENNYSYFSETIQYLSNFDSI